MAAEPTAGELLTLLAAADNAVATATGALKEAKTEYNAIADRIFTLMDEQQTEALRNSAVGLQCSISESDIDRIEDWDKFSQYVTRHKRLDLLQRRISPVALRELVESRNGKAVPGTGKFSVRRLHVTKFSK